MSDQSLEKLEFARPFDGQQPEVSDREQLEAAEAFRSLCEDTTLRAMDSVIHTNVLSYYTLTLPLEIQADDGSRLSVYVYSRDETAKEDTPPSEISIQEIDEQGFGRRIFRYELSRDGSCVRRVDVSDDAYEREQEDEARGTGLKRLTGSETQVEALVAAEDNLAFCLEAIQNAQLEKDMGLNEQPVGVDEVAALAEIVGSAEPKKPH